MTAKSSAGSSKTSPTRKKRSTPKTEQTVMEAVSDAQPRNDQSETTETTVGAKPGRKPRSASAATVSTSAARSRKAAKAEPSASAETGAKPVTAAKPARMTAEAPRPRTRAKKSEPSSPASSAPIVETPTADAGAGTTVKRGPGRPRKTEIAAPVAPAAKVTKTGSDKPSRSRKTKSGTERSTVVEPSTIEAAPVGALSVETSPAETTAQAADKAAPNKKSRRTGNARAEKPAPAPKSLVRVAKEKVAAQANAPVSESDHDSAAVEQAPLAAPAVAKRGRGRPKASTRPAPAPDTAETTSDAPASVADGEAPPAEAVAEAPRPLFSQLGLSTPIMRAIEEMGYEHPTPIQARAIPVVLSGRDVLGVAQTGTGKTASFTLPMLEKLAGSRARARMPRSLILEPTRELALQVAENLTLYGKHLRLNHALLIGGESMADQRAVLNQGVDILIATPGRLMDLFDRGGLLLTQTGILVIDEADRMLDMGFIPDITRIVSMLPVHRQTLLFSATMAPEIRTLADQFLHLPEEITVSRPSSVATTIEEALLVVDEAEKRRVLRKLLRRENVQNAIVFCNRKRDVDVLYKSLHKHGFAAGHLHGDLAQSLRFKTLERFKAGELKILVCSDVAARGIDIGGLSHVFNFDLPFNAEDYIHRIGRTGRAGKTGHAFSLASPRQKLLAEAIEKLKHAPIPMAEIEGIETLPWADPEQESAQPERRDRRGKDRGGRNQNRHGDNRDRDRAAAPAPERQVSRPKADQTAERHESERNSVAPTSAFDHDAPRTGFGHETPAFMLLPRRNRKTEHEDHVGPIQHRGTV